MKKIYLIIISIICMLSAHAMTIDYTVNINASDVVLTDTVIYGTKYIYPSIKEINNQAEYGQPSLPRVIISFALPINATDITISTIQAELYNSRQLDTPIIPYLPEVASEPIDTLAAYKYISNYRNTESIAELSHIENYKGINLIASVCVSPIQYDPAHSIAEIYSKCRFSISYNSANGIMQSNKAISSSKEYTHDVAFLKSIVVNPDEVGKFENSTNVPNRIVNGETYAYDYTIITSRELAPAFERLVALKQIQGYNAGIIYIENILNGSYQTEEMPAIGEDDDAGKLKSFLIHNSPYIKYVLLGGKPPIIPMRYGYDYNSEYPEYESFIPSDLYFGTTDTDWNHNGDSIMGEYYNGFNYTSQFYIGRLSCTTREEVENYVRKLEIYELNPGMGDPSYLTKSYTHISNDIYNHYGSVNNMENGLSNCFESNVISGVKEGGHTGNFTISEMNGDFGFYNIHGHGNPEGISTWDYNRNIKYGINGTDDGRVWLTDEIGNGLDNINNYGKPGVMLTGSCGTMPYDSPSYKGYGHYFPECNNIKYNVAESYCLGKDYGGVAYIGNTKEIYTSTAKEITDIFIGYMNIPDLTIGELTEYSRNTIVLTKTMGSGMHRDILGYGIIGDPALKIWNGKRTIPKRSPIDVVSYKRSTDETHILVNDNFDPNCLYTVSVVDLIRGKTKNYSISASDVVNYELVINGGGDNNIIYMTSKNTLPYIGNVDITSLHQMSNRFLYANNVRIGSVPSDSSSDVIISNGAILEIKACGNVEIMPSTEISDFNSGDKISTLIIRTPGKCTISGVKIGEKSKLIIYAGEIEIFSVDNGNLFGDPEIERKTLELHGYSEDESDVHVPVRIIDHRKLSIQKAKKKSSYYPLLQEGKEWRYTMYNPVIEAHPELFSGPIEVNRVIRLENPTEIDGETYLQANAYYAGEHQEDECNPIVYLREDESTKQVIMRMAHEGVPYSDYYTMGMYTELYYDSPDSVLYDFEKPMKCHIAKRSVEAKDTVFECLDGKHLGFDMQTSCGDFAIVEGIGCVHNYNKYGYTYDLFGFACSQMSSILDWCYYPYLYEVANADGAVIYRNAKFAPGWSSTPSLISDSEIKISVTEGNIVAQCPNEITEMSVFNSQGIEVAHGHGESGEISLSTTHLPKGVYMVHCGTNVQKVAIR